MKNEITENYYSRPELAEILGVDVRTLNRWEQMKKSPPVTKVGNKKYYRIEAFNKWLQSQEQMFTEA